MKLSRGEASEKKKIERDLRRDGRISTSNVLVYVLGIVLGAEHLLAEAAVLPGLDARVRRAGAPVVVAVAGEQHVATAGIVAARRHVSGVEIQVQGLRLGVGQRMRGGGEGDEDKVLESHFLVLGLF